MINRDRLRYETIGEGQYRDMVETSRDAMYSMLRSTRISSCAILSTNNSPRGLENSYASSSFPRTNDGQPIRLENFLMGTNGTSTVTRIQALWVQTIKDQKGKQEHIISKVEHSFFVHDVHSRDGGTSTRFQNIARSANALGRESFLAIVPRGKTYEIQTSGILNDAIEFTEEGDISDDSSCVSYLGRINNLSDFENQVIGYQNKYSDLSEFSENLGFAFEDKAQFENQVGVFTERCRMNLIRAISMTNYIDEFEDQMRKAELDRRK